MPCDFFFLKRFLNGDFLLWRWLGAKPGLYLNILADVWFPVISKNPEKQRPAEVQGWVCSNTTQTEDNLAI